MKVNLSNSNSAAENTFLSTGHDQATDTDALVQMLCKEMQAEVKASLECMQAVAKRITKEVERICEKSSRIKTSGQIKSWLVTLARHRLQKCLHYYQLGSKKGRVELHSQLGAIVYRHIVPPGSEMGFDARYNLIEDFLQAFYLEAIKAFRRENELPEDYTLHRQLELAEYMAFTEQYAKRRINLPNGTNQQLVILRAQGFARRLPQEITVDIEKLMEFAEAASASETLPSISKYTLKFYLSPQLYTQLIFQSGVDLDLMLGIVEQALASFLANADEPEASNSQNYRIYTCEDYDKILEINPNDYKAWYARGVILKNLGSYEEALASLDKALEIKPDFYKAWYARGNALYGLDFYEEAIASYDKAIELKPGYPEAWYYRGKALNELGSHEEAIASFQQATKIKPKLQQICYGSERVASEFRQICEQGIESANIEEGKSYQRNSAVQQVRSQMIAQPKFDPSEESERDRIISELVKYLESQGQSDCIDYLTLKLQDFSAPEIDQILGLTSSQRDYLQQHFKYHVEKFAKQHHWQLVHQWLGAGLEQKLGLASQQWEYFLSQLSEQQRQILQLKAAKQSDQAIVEAIKCTPKQLQKRWTQLLELAWDIRNGSTEIQAG